MKIRVSSLMSIFLIILCLNSILYYDIQYSDIKYEEEISNLNPFDVIVGYGVKSTTFSRSAFSFTIIKD